MSAQIYGPGINAPASPWPRLAAAGGLLLIALLSGLLLTENPRGILKRPSEKADMPWLGSFGVRELYITPDGTWILTRQGYVDRMQRYTIAPDGSLSVERDTIRGYKGADVGGAFNSQWMGVSEGTQLRVTPPGNSGYRKWMRLLRKMPSLRNYLNPLPESPESAQNFVGPLPPDPPLEEVTSSRLARQILDRSEGGTRITFNQYDHLEDILVLEDHWYFESYDAICLAGLDLYVTTDRQRMLHRLRVDQSAARPRVVLQASTPLDLPGPLPDRTCHLAHDPQRGLCLVRPDGMRFIFDPQTLELRETDRLPGNWQHEHASFELRPGQHSPHLGDPLSQLQYERIMRALMLVFLASLLGLAMLWRPQWKSTSARITADSNSSEASPPT